MSPVPLVGAFSQARWGHLRRATVAAPALACTRRAWVGAAAGAALAKLLGCAPAQVPAPLEGIGPKLAQVLDGPAALPDILILGERHDAPDHHALQAEVVRRLVATDRLAALVLEMADQGRSTAGLADSERLDEARLRAALGWNAQAWPWPARAPLVRTASAAGVAVLGGNLPRSGLRAVMQDAGQDTRLDPAALERQRAAVRDGHCGLLPESQIGPMTRVQIARDVAMAQTAAQAVQPGRCVVLVCGAMHALRSVGVPRHLPVGLRVHVVVAQALGPAGVSPPPMGSAGDIDTLVRTPPLPERDDCAPLRDRRVPTPPAPERRT